MTPKDSTMSATGTMTLADSSIRLEINKGKSLMCAVPTSVGLIMGGIFKRGSTNLETGSPTIRRNISRFLNPREHQVEWETHVFPHF